MECLLGSHGRVAQAKDCHQSEINLIDSLARGNPWISSKALIMLQIFHGGRIASVANRGLTLSLKMFRTAQQKRPAGYATGRPFC
jgi:hypothetical protein